jgi:hypothetical protein
MTKERKTELDQVRSRLIAALREWRKLLAVHATKRSCGIQFRRPGWSRDPSPGQFTISTWE